MKETTTEGFTDSVRCSRRGFLGSVLMGGAAWLTPAWALGRRSTLTADPDVLRIGHITPLGGRLQATSQAAVRGAELGAAEAGQAAELLGHRLEIVSADADGPPASVEAAGRLVEEGRVFALLGGFDEASARALSEWAAEQGVIFVNVGSTSDDLREAGCGRTTFHIEASAAMYRDTLARWQADAAAAGAAEAAGASGALWHHTLERYGAGQVNDRFYSRFQLPLDGAGWASWLGVKFLWEAAARSRTTETEGLLRFLENSRTRFDGHKGVHLSFRPWDHQLRQPLYVVWPASGDGSGPQAPRVLTTVPAAPRDPQVSWAELLDQIGTGADRSTCGR